MPLLCRHQGNTQKHPANQIYLVCLQRVVHQVQFFTYAESEVNKRVSSLLSVRHSAATVCWVALRHMRGTCSVRKLRIESVYPCLVMRRKKNTVSYITIILECNFMHKHYLSEHLASLLYSA